MRARPTIVYTVLRLLFFIVPFALMMLLPPLREYYWLAAIFAALIGLSLSVIFLRKPLTEMTSGMAQRRAAKTAPPETDEDVEDRLV